ncbi:P22 coat - protein 5 family protein [Candidatus Pacearchaeota archaeon]|nr:P22 coat - protein 5 family protein [Candidatus Pacearchaeota archaeon]
MAANTLTNLIPTLYLALDTVSRELVGMIPAVRRDSTLERAAIGQTVRSHVAPAATSRTITPDQLRPDDGEQTIGNIDLAITKSKAVPVRWQGEESKQMNSEGGPTVSAIMVDQFSQGMRTLVNEIESDLAGLYVNASRAVVPNSSTPFSSNLADAANVRKILADNGAPMSDLQLVIGTTEGAALRTLTQLSNVNEAGNDSLLRQGVLLDIHGMAVRESAQIVAPAVGTEADATLHATADYAKGTTTMALDAVGTGTIVAGDLVTFAATGLTTTQFINKTLIAAVSGSAIEINKPGLTLAITDNAAAVAVRASANRNLCFDRGAIVLATRMPALPEGGDSAVDRVTITDPRSGLSFEVAHYLEYHQSAFEITIAWGVKAVKEEHIAILAGV